MPSFRQVSFRGIFFSSPSLFLLFLLVLSSVHVQNFEADSLPRLLRFVLFALKSPSQPLGISAGLAPTTASTVNAPCSSVFPPPHHADPLFSTSLQRINAEQRRHERADHRVLNQMEGGKERHLH